MKKRDLMLALAIYARRIKTYTECITMSMASLGDILPMEETLKEKSRIMSDHKGEIFLYYDGIFYSWEIITSILKEKGIIKISDLYECGINL